MTLVKFSKYPWCSCILRLQQTSAISTSTTVNMKVKPKSEKYAMIRRSQKSKWQKFLRKCDGFPTSAQAPHISLVYNSEYENYLYGYNPIAQLSATAFMVFMYNDMIDNEIVIQNASGLSPGTVIAIIGSYGLFLLCCMGWFAKKIPMRIYYDEANDKTVAVFMHLLIPFRFSKKSLPHHSFRIIKTNAKDGYSISNGQLKLMLTPGMFRKPADFTRLLSQ